MRASCSPAAVTASSHTGARMKGTPFASSKARSTRSMPSRWTERGTTLRVVALRASSSSFPTMRASCRRLETATLAQSTRSRSAPTRSGSCRSARREPSSSGSTRTQLVRSMSRSRSSKDSLSHKAVALRTFGFDHPRLSLIVFTGRCGLEEILGCERAGSTCTVPRVFSVRVRHMLAIATNTHGGNCPASLRCESERRFLERFARLLRCDHAPRSARENGGIAPFHYHGRSFFR
mmetsp:Transcript_6353/g.17679  ORF Transcript_6353/g.17679 Transcript_6353/m.17679 type:complete len:235 (+) Transcript_6353:893-1597(+)